MFETVAIIFLIIQLIIVKFVISNILSDLTFLMLNSLIMLLNNERKINITLLFIVLLFGLLV